MSKANEINDGKWEAEEEESFFRKEKQKEDVPSVTACLWLFANLLLLLLMLVSFDLMGT